MINPMADIIWGTFKYLIPKGCAYNACVCLSSPCIYFQLLKYTEKKKDKIYKTEDWK